MLRSLVGSEMCIRDSTRFAPVYHRETGQLLNGDFPEGAWYNPECSGAEFWVQMKSPGQGLRLHWDKDESLRDHCGLTICPALSTVTYMSDDGAPTLVLDARVDNQGNSVKADITQAALSFPRKFKHFKFDGELLHSIAPHHAVHPGPDPRLSILVNIWLDHHPVGVEPISQPVVDMMAGPDIRVGFVGPEQWGGVKELEVESGEDGVVPAEFGPTLTEHKLQYRVPSPHPHPHPHHGGTENVKEPHPSPNPHMLLISYAPGAAWLR
eukprot:TRINITY_DN24245_c0_g1_i2.p1 TRINITY_DN24245_c0_g1~~TRINITY_DN24245_c0_g1_i2.p1  ORF type:complete len:267 (+),score=47.15 TRINITY_DN24245_c0_g1_i2:70-870(+)